MGEEMNNHEEYVRSQLDNAYNTQSYGHAVNGHHSVTTILCFILGWQGGTIHQVSQVLGVTNNLILNADYHTQEWLFRLAQLRRQDAKNQECLTIKNLPAEAKGKLDHFECMHCEVCKRKHPQPERKEENPCNRAKSML